MGFSYLLRSVYMVTIHNDDVGTSPLQFMFGRNISSCKLRRKCFKIVNEKNISILDRR